MQTTGKVLMICTYFAPDASIAAIRTTKLAKYLRLHGYHVDFIMEGQKPCGEDEILRHDAEGISVFRVENSQRFISFVNRYKKWIKPHKENRFNNFENRRKLNKKSGQIEFYPFEVAYPVLGSLDYIVEQLRQKDLFREAKKLLKDMEGYDYVLTSYGESFACFCGVYFKKHHKNTTWLFDLRDPIYRHKFVPKYIRFIPKGYEKKIWKNADVITGVSRGMCKRVPPRFRDKVQLVTNGYDREDLSSVNDWEMDRDKLHFVYTGSMYGGMRDLSAFFQAVGDLIFQKKIPCESVQLHFAGNGPAFEVFKRQAAVGNLENNCIYHGRLSRRETMGLQRGADFLLVAAYDYEGNPEGLITGKIYEYMMADRPVISVVNGNMTDNELTEIVRKTGVGIAYEESNHESDYQRLQDYLLMQYERKQKGNCLLYEPVEEEVEKFDYKVIGNRLVEILENGR